MPNTTAIYIRLSDDENTIVEVYKAVNKLGTKEEAVKEMIHNQKEEVWKNVCGEHKPSRRKRG